MEEEIAIINTLIFNTIFSPNDNTIYSIDNNNYYLFDTDQLFGKKGNSLKNPMMYILDGSKNYVFISDNSLNMIISSSNIKGTTLIKQNVNKSDNLKEETLKEETLPQIEVLQYIHSIIKKDIIPEEEEPVEIDNAELEEESIKFKNAELIEEDPVDIDNTDVISNITQIENEIIILYSKTHFEKVRQKISSFERNQFFKNMYEEVYNNALLYEEILEKINNWILSAKGDDYSEVRLMIELIDQEIFNIPTFSKKFEISEEIVRILSLMIKDAYNNFYMKEKSYSEYIDYIYDYIISNILCVLSNTNVENAENTKYINSLHKQCYEEFVRFKPEILIIGEICEVIFYFIGRYKQLTKQTCASLFNDIFIKSFKESKLYNLKKRQLIKLNNELLQLENLRDMLHTAIKTIRGKEIKKEEQVKKEEQTKSKLRKVYENIINIKLQIGLLDNEISDIKDSYKLYFFIIIHAFIEYPLMTTYFKRSINLNNNTILSRLHIKLSKCNIYNYINILPQLLEEFTILTEVDRNIGYSFIKNVIYSNKKLENIEISPKRGTIIENIIYDLYEIENKDTIISLPKNIAFILYVAMYFYI